MLAAQVEATKLRTTKRAELFTSFLKQNIMKLGKKKKPKAQHGFEPGETRGRRMSLRPGEVTQNEAKLRGLETMLDANMLPDRGDGDPLSPEDRRKRLHANRVRSMSMESDCDSDASEAGPPHALDAVIPIEEASERGERALLALARVENSGTRVPLALLTILSFTLGLAGGVYLLLPFTRDSCQPLALILANAYIAFFYIFFIPNVLIVTVAIIEMSSINPDNHRLRDILENAMARLDDIFFLGQVPLCTFVAKRLLLKSTAPPLDGSRLKALLRRDAYILKHRKRELEMAMQDCDEQIAAVNSIRRRARLAFKKKDTINPLADAPALKVKRYTRYVPEVQWRQSFVPVYRELDPATPIDAEGDPYPTGGGPPLRRNPSPLKGSFARALSRASSSLSSDDPHRNSSDFGRRDSDDFFDAIHYDEDNC